MSMRCTWSPSFNCLVRAGNQGIACSAISLSIWFKWDDTAANYEAIEINGSAGGFFAACIEIASGDITFHITNADGSSRISVVGPAYSAGVWTHGALTYDNTTLTGFVNGASVGTATGLVGTRGNWSDLQVGPGVGELQDAFFYQRAITPEEVVAHYRGRFPKNPQNLRHWLPLHPGSNRLVDYSGNALNFSNSGSPADGTTVPPVGWGAGRTRSLLQSGTPVAADGVGLTKFNGAGTPAVAVAGGGAGLTKFNAAGTPAVAINADSVSFVQMRFFGAATPAVAAAADAAGLAKFNGSGAPSIAAAPVAEGKTAFGGSATASVAVDAAAAGLTKFNGLASGASGAAGEGRTAFGGSATASVSIAAAAAGLTRFNGSGTGSTGGGSGPGVAVLGAVAGQRRHNVAFGTRRKVR